MGGYIFLTMYLYTIGFTQKTAQQFFDPIKHYGIQILVDVRLYTKSQLSGFTNGRDMPYFLDRLCDCKYEHRIDYAPTKKLLNDYRKEFITWQEYAVQYKFIIDERKAVHDFITKYYGVYDRVCLLCSEPTPEHCHRRLLAEMIHEQRPDIEILHI